MTWGDEPWKQADISNVRGNPTSLALYRKRLQKWLDEHPDPEPKSFQTCLYEAFGRIFGFYTPPPPPTAQEIVDDVMEMTQKAWVKAQLHVIDEKLKGNL